MSRERKTHIAVVGCGGYARSHHRAIQRMETEGIMQLVATCEPNGARLDSARFEFGLEQRGVRCFSDIDSMLDAIDPPELITLPLPLPLHRPFHRQCVERGLPVYLEKPPTLDPSELKTMLATERAAKVPTTVGFNYIYESRRQELKRRILEGAFGPLRAVSFTGHWPRPPAYYERNNWGGRLFLNGYPVLDSPVGNAFSHFAHNLLYWAGPTQNAWAQAEEVTAAYFRSRAIQSADTVFIKAGLENDIELRFAASHTFNQTLQQTEILSFPEYRILYDSYRGYRIEHHGAVCEEGMIAEGHALSQNLAAACQRATGLDSPAFTRLQDSLPFVHLQAAALLAAGPIRHLEPIDWTTESGEHPAGIPIVEHLSGDLARFAEAGRWPRFNSEEPSPIRLDAIDFESELPKIETANPAP